LKRRSKKKSRIENEDGKTYILIDSNALAWAAYYTTGGLSYGGQNTGVIYGFLKSFIQIADKLKSPDIIFCWDQGNSFRMVNYDNYKISRREKYLKASPEEKADHEDFLLQRKQLANVILYHIGLKNSFSFENYEGDDLIGKLVNQLGGKKIIVTSDNDMFQLLDRADIYLIKQKKLFTEKHFIKKYGIHPDQWVMAKAIGGCSGDDIEGIEGIGDPKNPSSKALKYLRGELPNGKIMDKIKSKKCKLIIERNIPLVTVPYMEDIMPEMKIKKNTVTKKKLLRVFDQFRMVSLMEKENLSKWERVFNL
jgi:5'-3' exonuclease